MKFFLIAALSMGISTSAFSACSVSSPQDCTSDTDCIGLNTAGGTAGPKFNFDTARPVKCMTVVPDEISDCNKVANMNKADKPVIPAVKVKTTTDAPTGTTK